MNYGIIMKTEEILQYSKELIQMKGKCETCTLRKDIDDGMNITSYCIISQKTVDKLTSKCHLSKEDQEELDDKYQIYYNYLTPEKLKQMLEKAGFVIDSIQIVKDNDNASSYATGLMIFQAKNQMANNLIQ